MNRIREANSGRKAAESLKPSTVSYKNIKEIKFQESPIERALKISSDEIIALAIRDMLNKDYLN